MLKIEVPKITDYEKINNLAKQVHKLHIKWRPDIFKDVEDVIKREELEAMIKSKKIYIVKEENKIVGYMTLGVKEEINPILNEKKYLVIHSICVDKNYRRKGIGTYLLEFSKKLAKKQNCTDLYLTANEENKNAIKLYKKFGFKVKNISFSMKI